MPRNTLQRTAVALGLALGLLACSVGSRAGEPPAPKDGGEPAKAENRRLLYLARHGTAKDLAAVLGAHFKGAAEFQALPDSPSECLLINASPAVFDEVVKVLEQLDRTPRTVMIEVLFVEITVPKADGDKPAAADQRPDEKAFSGPTAEVGARVDALKKQGVLGGLKRVQFAAVEGQPTSAMIGETKPFVMGVHTTGTGVVSRSITYHSIGIKVDATARVSPDRVVSLDLKAEESHAGAPDSGPSIGVDENGKALRAPEFDLTNLNTRLSLASGQTVLAQGAKEGAHSDGGQTLVLVSARIVEPEAKSEK